MSKWQIICPVSAMALVAVLLVLSSGSRHRRYHLFAQTRMIGQELITTRNSPRLLPLGSDAEKRLAEFLSSGASAAAVMLDDEPPPVGDGTAASRLILSNAAGETLGIRLSHEPESRRFRILGFWTNQEDPGVMNGR